jgi:hypothetical protein
LMNTGRSWPRLGRPRRPGPALIVAFPPLILEGRKMRGWFTAVGKKSRSVAIDTCQSAPQTCFSFFFPFFAHPASVHTGRVPSWRFCALPGCHAE